MPVLNEKRWKPLEIVYSVILCFLLLGYLYVIAVYQEASLKKPVFVFPSLFIVLRIVSGILAIYLGKLWKNKGFLLLAAYLLLKIVRVGFADTRMLLSESVKESIFTGFWVFSACYGFAWVLSGKHLKTILRMTGTIWTIGIVFYSSLGLIAAWNNIWINNIGEGSVWGIINRRLWLVYYVTTSGAVLSISVVIALCCAASCNKRITRFFFLLAILPMLVSLSLTDSRGAQVSVSAGIAVCAGICVLHQALKKAHAFHTNTPCKKKWAIWPLAFVVTAGVFFGVVFCLMNTISLFNQLRAGNVSLITHAAAEEIKNSASAISNRGYSGWNVLTSRPMIWEAVITYLKENPVLLLIGTSIVNPMAGVNNVPSLTFTAWHTHCMPLMVLLENGIPGLMIIGSFFVLFAIRAWRVLNHGAELWKKAVISVVVSVLVGDLVECFSWLRAGQAPVLPFLFVAAGLVIAEGQKPAS